MVTARDIAKIGTALMLVIILSEWIFFTSGKIIGRWIRSRTAQRRELLLSRSATERKQQSQLGVSDSKKASSSTSLDEDWEKVSSSDKTPPKVDSSKADSSFNGIIGFFHPFANAGGGGERVLFAAIHATQQRYPDALCVVYTGDHDVTKEQILGTAQTRFNITLNTAAVAFLHLTTRDYVLASRYPRLTLLGQSLGSLVLGWDAFNLVVPDVIIDTMGYAFVLALTKWLFPWMPTCAYVHYPTISTDMIDSLSDKTGSQGLNAGSGKGPVGKMKQFYWLLFANVYSWAGGRIDVVMTNSTWTQRHITSLWTRSRATSGKKVPISIVYPPCAVEELHKTIPVDSNSERQRNRTLLYISQFRPEKMHATIISSFIKYLKTLDANAEKPKLILAGSVRDDQDEKGVYKLRLQAQEIKDHVEFVVNGKWTQMLELLRTSSIGVNGMWNEHFGIGVVEYQAAGLVSVVNDSGGPGEDIVVDVDGLPTGMYFLLRVIAFMRA